MVSSGTISDQQAWAAVSAHDPAWDGRVFYAVRTTGIFCRPSCPARRPKRKNVEFFSSAEAAEAEGYRACHRCHPKSAGGTPAEKRVERAREYLEQHLDERVTLEQLGSAVGLSPYHLQRKFKKTVGLSPRDYQNARRLEVMKSHLREGAQVGRAVWRAGYGSVRGAYEAAASGLGMTPGQYRDGGNGLSIRYSVHQTSFGILVAGWTDRGICAVMLGNSTEELVEELESEFPSAELAEEAGDARRWIGSVLAYLEGEHPGLAVPVDLHGSNFQLRVWKALQDIPLGEVRSYKEVATAIGAPGSSRAVARACASNKAALVVPCHRVVRSDGSLSGYRWGEERKGRLLELEKRLRGHAEAE